MTNNVEIKNNRIKSAAVELNDNKANLNLHQSIKSMDTDNMDLNTTTISLDSDGDEILEETTPKMVSFKDQENRISHLVANAVSAKTSLQIKKEIMTSQASNTANQTYKADKEPDGFITVGRNNKPKLSNTTADNDRWINMDDDTQDDKDIRANALANALQRKMNARTGTMKSNFKTVTRLRNPVLKPNISHIASSQPTRT